jgi:predicted choloylglycine hydrolase
MEAAVKVGDMAAQKKFIASRDKRLKEFEGRK